MDFRSILCAAVAIAIFPVIAQAKSYDVSGELNTGGKLIQYSTYRSHDFGGASLRIYDNVGTYSRFGLRDEHDNQVTRSNQYNGSGGDKDFIMNNGSRVIPTGSYALNGRMGPRMLADRFWKGILNL